MEDRKARGWTGVSKNDDLESCEVCKPIYSNEDVDSEKDENEEENDE